MKADGEEDQGVSPGHSNTGDCGKGDPPSQKTEREGLMLYRRKAQKGVVFWKPNEEC